ncbi:sensor domain-containing diguanylate cyclase [Neobacillus sp. D3-1R]|uniref:sensor domain-containing diguanylate cyclase n=1 Tax=Neobacillus sp. D3-1R TaxID=3445778 RepID=UPI003F9F032C
MNIKLRTYFAAIFAIVIFGLTIVLSFSIGKQSSEKVKNEIGHALSTTAYQMADKLDFFMWSRSAEMDILSQLKDIQNPSDQQHVQNLLNQLQKSFPSFSWVGLTDANGKVLVATNDILKGEDISERPVFTEGIKGNFIGDVHNAVLLAKLLPNPSGEPLQFVDISKAIVDENGHPIGVLAAHLSWEWSRQVQDEIVKPLKEEMQDAELFVVSADHNTVVLGPKELVGQPLQLDSIELARKGDSNWSLEIWPDGKEYLTGYAFGKGYQDYPGLGWTTLVRVPVEKAFVPVKELQKSIFIIGVTSSVIFAIIGWFLAGFITNPLRDITHSANLLRAGRKVEIPSYKGIKDIEILSASLRELVDSLVKTTSDLDKMETIAHHDKLTGLRNRMALDHFFEETMEKAKSMNNTITFLYLDLDGFKGVNDTYGHHTGDLMLQEVANRLKNCVHGDEVFRLGGDEFLVGLITSSVNDKQEALKAAEKIIHSLNKPFHLSNEKIHVGCSIGGAVWPKDDIEPIAVIRYADEALYKSKRTGKNKVTFQ